MSPDDERTTVAEISERLIARHPDVPRATVDNVVREVNQDFADSRVRAFIPLLVERYAGARLDDSGLDGPPRSTADDRRGAAATHAERHTRGDE